LADSLDATFRLLLFGPNTPLEGAKIRACSINDQTCAAPRSEVAVADANGNVQVHVTDAGGGFFGHYEITRDDLVPMMLFVPPMRSDTFYGDQYGIAKDEFDAIVATFGGHADRGHMVVRARDCLGTYAARLRVDASPRDGAKIGYLAGGFPSTTATETDSSGVAGIFDLAPLTGITVQAKQIDLDLSYPSTTVFTRVGWASEVMLDASWW
jgi:hypothetical protein